MRAVAASAPVFMGLPNSAARDTGNSVSHENVEFVRRGYAAISEMLRRREVDLASIEQWWHPDCVLKPSGLLPESSEMHGHEGIAQFMRIQMDAFEELQVEPIEFLDAGDRVVVPVRFGGKARHTGLDVEFSVVHVATLRADKVARVDMFGDRAEALEAVGLAE
jgi:ketosteroid isomerase-like protein